MNQYPALKWIPDTAHQTIAGENPIQALGLVPSSRLACVHLKDWSSIYGRTSHRYSKGFCELGDGEIDLEEIVAYIKAELPRSWIVIEQDYTLDDPLDCLYRAAVWLYDHGLLQQRPLRNPHGRLYPSYPSITGERELAFRHALATVRAGEPGAFHNDLAQAFHELIQSENITVWSCSSNGGLLILRGTWPPDLEVSRTVVQTEKTLSCLALHWQQPICFDLTNTHPAEHLGFPERTLAVDELITNDHCRWLLALPIFSTFNPNHESLLIVAVGERETDTTTLSDLMGLAAEASEVADHVLDERCTYYSAKLARAAERCSKLSDFYVALTKLLRNAVAAQSASVFVVSSSGGRLEHKHTAPNLDQNFPDFEKHNKVAGGSVGYVWKNKRLVNEYPGIPRQTKHLGSPGPRTSRLLAPLVDRSGEVLGVVECCGIEPELRTHLGFTDEDEAIVEAICQSAVPHLNVLVGDNRREQAVLRLVHELGSPLVTMNWALCATAEELLSASSNTDPMTLKVIQDGFSYCDVMLRLVNNLHLFGMPQLPLHVNEAVKLRGDILTPTVKQSSGLLRNRNFEVGQVEYQVSDEVIGLFVDLELFRQVIFNLLSNAIKYAFNDPRAFSVKIVAEKESSGDFLISFKDYGIGVPPGWSERIFEETERAPNTRRLNIYGQGLGLWIARRIVEAHGGDLWLAKDTQPTEFRMRLPGWLARRHPTILDRP